MNEEEDDNRRIARGRFAASEAARRTVQALALAFSDAELPLAPLKGVLLVHAHGHDPITRPISDVDVLVPAERFDEATALANQAGWTCVKEESEGRKRLLLPRAGGLAVDLHASLFPPNVFALETRDLFARSSPDAASFGAPVRLLSPLDTAAHLVGHIALTFLFEHRIHHPHDLEFLAERTKIDAHALAQRLRTSGMEFAARYVLRLPTLGDSALSCNVLRALGPSWPRDAGAWAVRTLVPMLPPRRHLGLLPPAVMHRPVASGVGNVGRAILRRARR